MSLVGLRKFSGDVLVPLMKLEKLDQVGLK